MVYSTGSDTLISSILIAAGKEAGRWSSRGIAIAGKSRLLSRSQGASPPLTVIVFATLLHGLTPRLGIIVMNVSEAFNCHNCRTNTSAYQGLSVFKIVILLFVVITGTSSCFQIDYGISLTPHLRSKGWVVL